MTTQIYLMIDESNNIVYSTCMWDGDINTWQPPSGTLMLVKSETSAMLWILDSALFPPDYVLAEFVGQGDVGYLWDGFACITNQPKPTPPKSADIQPTAIGTTTI